MRTFALDFNRGDFMSEPIIHAGWQVTEIEKRPDPCGEDDVIAFVPVGKFTNLFAADGAVIEFGPFGGISVKCQRARVGLETVKFYGRVHETEAPGQ